jgi:hypothetical protein
LEQELIKFYSFVEKELNEILHSELNKSIGIIMKKMDNRIKKFERNNGKIDAETMFATHFIVLTFISKHIESIYVHYCNEVDIDIEKLKNCVTELNRANVN